MQRRLNYSNTTKSNRPVLLATLLIALALTSSACATLDEPQVGTPVWEGTSAARLVLTIPDEVVLNLPEMPQAAATWPEMIRAARRSIDIAQFYVYHRPDGPIEAVLAELEAAGARGVRIRFLVSNALLDEDTATIERLRRIPNTTVRILDYKSLNDGALHAKYWVVDGALAYVGSQNFDDRSLSHVQEMGLEVRDVRIARKLTEVFEIDWRIAESRRAPSTLHTSSARTALSGDIELVASPPEWNPPGMRAAEDALVELIDSATKSIRIQLLSYGTVYDKRKYWNTIDAALRAAAVRGVKVKLMVAHWNTDTPAVDHLKSLSLIPNIEVRIVTIPEHSSGFIPYARVIHAKSMIIDDKTLWIGTSNWSRHYFDTMRNVELIVKRPPLAEQARDVHESLWSSPYAAPIDVTRSYPRPRRG
jgi:phosphatidylserine/phosphatidylglycerophosphate/cardiolipin synthase-like enzyme